jgi:pyruvate-formate lyase
MERVGVSTEDARNYCIDACQDLMIEGKSDFYAIFAGHYGIHLLTIMERIVDRLPEYSSFEEFYQAFKDEIGRDIREFAEKANAIDEFLPSISPTPFLSATLDGWIESGKDKTEGGTTYNFTGFVGGGIINVANSLAAIKKLVYEEKFESYRKHYVEHKRKCPPCQANKPDYFSERQGPHPLQAVFLRYHSANHVGINNIISFPCLSLRPTHFLRELCDCTLPPR